ncbi:50S ribosomal protein L21 [Yoonia litorea]|uniref:Large ribosomal subunit protein bL21 n=1 Tax=Yoonia litorea TaxID=1123755 RepID=A0A1I6M641_9RHOB|nr:50S ribosomal protein L21 [Yoonia litorea]SFS11167.1 LSU ribosomal protein L21P [Yoonia litorea]
MFAVLKTGGKQYKVAAGDVLRVEKLAANAGDKVQFNEILMVGSTVGTPLVEGAGVQAEVIDQIKGEKTINFVKRRRKHGSQRKKGHRQQLTLVRISDILEKGADKSGVMAAVSGAGLAHVVSDGRYADNKTEQREMDRRVAEGEANEKPAETKAKAPKKTKAAEGGDDLKKLSGVGPALEKKLHDAGVTTFAQIAAWTEEDVAAMDEKLSFKGRIEREGWIAQAAELAKG